MNSKSATKRKKLVQSVFRVNGDTTTCKECGMSYIKSVKSDSLHHLKYHDKVINGLKFNLKTYEIVNKVSEDEFIIVVNTLAKQQVKFALEFLEIVNNSLNASDENDCWLHNNGKVYIYIKKSRAVGILVAEKVEFGSWYSIKHQTIVNSKIKIPLVCGISRVFVSKSQRRSGTASCLLNTLTGSFIYGIKLSKRQVGWSQPSTIGSKLAESFNSVRHANGALLLAVYIPGATSSNPSTPTSTQKG